MKTNRMKTAGAGILGLFMLGGSVLGLAPEAHGLNPQPLPPRDYTVAMAYSNPLTLRALNPQPLPPKSIGVGIGSPFESRMLNPQPLPPKVQFGRTPYGIRSR